MYQRKPEYNILTNLPQGVLCLVLMSGLVMSFFSTPLTVYSQIPGNDVPENPTTTSVGLPTPSVPGQDQNQSLNTSQPTQQPTPQVPTSFPSTSEVPINLESQDQTVRTGGFGMFLLVFIITASGLGYLYYKKNSYKSSLKTFEKKIRNSKKFFN